MAADRDPAPPAAEPLATVQTLEALRDNVEPRITSLSDLYNAFLKPDAPLRKVYDAGELSARQSAHIYGSLCLFSVFPHEGVDVRISPRNPFIKQFLVCAGVLDDDGEPSTIPRHLFRSVCVGICRFVQELLSDADNNARLVAGILEKKRLDAAWGGVLASLTPTSWLQVNDGGYFVVMPAPPAEAARELATPTAAARQARPTAVLPVVSTASDSVATAAVAIGTTAASSSDSFTTIQTLQALRDNVVPCITCLSDLFNALLKPGAPLQKAYDDGHFGGPDESTPVNALRLFSINPPAGSKNVRIFLRFPFIARFLKLTGVLDDAADETRVPEYAYRAVFAGICRFVQELLSYPDNNASLVASMMRKRNAPEWAGALPTLTRSSWLTLDDTGVFQVESATGAAASADAADDEPDLASPMAAVAVAASAAPATPVADAPPLKLQGSSDESRAHLELARALDAGVQYGHPIFISMIRLPGRRHMVVDFTPGKGLVVARAGGRLPAGTPDPDHVIHREWCLQFLDAMTPEASGTDWYRRDTAHGCLKLIVEARAPYAGPLSAVREPELAGAAAATAASAGDAATRPAATPRLDPRPAALQSPGSRTRPSPAVDSGFPSRGGAATGGAGASA